MAHQQRTDEVATAADMRKTYLLRKWVSCRRVMRKYDKWSGATGAFSNRLSTSDSSDGGSDDDRDFADTGDSAC